MKVEEYPFIVCRTEKNSDIVFIKFPNQLKIDLAVAREIVATRLKFANEKKHYLILDISNIRQISSKAKAYLQQPDAGLKNILGAVFVATNPVSALIASIFLKTPKQFEARLFSDEEEAFDCICDYREMIRCKFEGP